MVRLVRHVLGLSIFVHGYVYNFLLQTLNPIKWPSTGFELTWGWGFNPPPPQVPLFIPLWPSQNQPLSSCCVVEPPPPSSFFTIRSLTVDVWLINELGWVPTPRYAGYISFPIIIGLSYSMKPGLWWVFPIIIGLGYNPRTRVTLNMFTASSWKHFMQ